MHYFITIKVLLADIICSPVIGKIIFYLFNGKIPHRGSIIEVPKDNDPAICAMLFWGLYESAEIRFIRKYLRNDLDVIELGSSLGGVSLEILKKLSIEKSLLCLEPNKVNFSFLQINLKRHYLYYNCNVMNAAIDYSSANEVNLSVGNNNLMSKVTNGSLINSDTSLVSTITLSKILENKNIDYTLISDIEGAELGIILYDLEALRNCKLMIIELHETHLNGVYYSVQDIVNLIVETGKMEILDFYDNVYVFSKNI